jgi:hypothetical protein
MQLTLVFDQPRHREDISCRLLPVLALLLLLLLPCMQKRPWLLINQSLSITRRT